MITSVIRCLIGLILLSAAPISVQGQSDPQSGSPLDQRVDALRQELEMEKLRTALAEQRRRTVEASMPEVSAETRKGLRGEISNRELPEGQFGTESLALSYESLSALAREISRSVNTNAEECNRIVIYSEADFKHLVLYRLFQSQAVPALEAYERLLDNRPLDREGMRGMRQQELLQLPNLGTALVGSAIDLIALFRTDTTVSNRKISIEPTALAALVSNELRQIKPGLKVYYPMAYIPEGQWQEDDETSVLTRLTRLYSYHDVVRGILENYANASPEDKKKYPPVDHIVALASLNRRVDALLASFQNKQGQDVAGIRELVRAEQLSRMLEGENTGILQLKVLEAGGSQVTTRNLIFGSKVRYSGSAVVEYMLFAPDGTLRTAETLYYHTGFQEMNGTRHPRKSSALVNQP